MSQIIKLLFFFVFFIVLNVYKADASGDTIFCYWGTWSYYRSGNGKFDITNINPNLCTHIGYAFFGLSDSNEIKILDPWLDINLKNIAKTVALKKVNPKLKVLASIGGWNEGSTKFSIMASDAGRRATFINSVERFLSEYGFDGLDLDWEYPAQRDGSTADRQNFIILLKELNERLKKKNLLLTAAVAATAASAKISYNVAEMSKYLDMINVMTYDMSGPWNNVLGYNAPLKGGALSVTNSIEYWLEQGAPANKLILGIPFYGHSFTLADKSRTTVGSPSSGPGNAGPYTREAGYLGYNEICTDLKKWQRQWDDQSSVPYIYNGNQWVSYDDVQSIKLKVNYIKTKKLGGAMIWSIETDDFRGECGSSFPLLNAIKQNLNGTSKDTEAPGELPVVIECQSDGIFGNPYDCFKFFMCSNKTRYDFVCPSGLKFDITANNCNWPALAVCAK